MVYLATLPNRRRLGYRVHLTWPDAYWADKGHDVRRIYRRLRTHGIDAMGARWMIWDLLRVGQLAEWCEK